MIIAGKIRGARATLASCALFFASATTATSDDALLKEVVTFEGQILFIGMNVPGMILAVVRNGESVVVGFGQSAEGAGEPDGDTILRVGSISKVFTGQVFASLVADGTVHVTDRLQDRLGWQVKVPELQGHEITLLNLATHGSGLPREVERVRDPAKPDFVSRETYTAALGTQALLFPPGTGLHYSNYGFDLLSEALAKSAGRPYSQLLKERAFDPAGLKDTRLRLAENDIRRLFQGHGPDGRSIANTDVSDIQAGASGLYSTANDMVRWLAWHLARASRTDAETRALDHAAYVNRDGLNPVSGLDELGHMNAMGLGWVIMNPEGDRPLILQKSGGRQGTLSYIALSPARNIGVFISINKFDFPAATAMAELANNLILQLAPR
jgi:D-alanyl-D-alanine-carboxypeptidase/D-alanyl-D-alanine-endopeptidase